MKKKRKLLPDKRVSTRVRLGNTGTKLSGSNS